MISFGYPYLFYDAPRVPTYINAYSATETMQRVRRNCERLVKNLRSVGYDFTRYPDGSRRSMPIASPNCATCWRASWGASAPSGH